MGSSAYHPLSGLCKTPGADLYISRDGSYNENVTKRHRLNASRIEQALKELKELAAELGFRVRDERLLGEVGYRVRSGACRVREEPTIFLDRKLPPRNRIEILADHLGSKLDGAELSEDLRQLVGRP